MSAARAHGTVEKAKRAAAALADLGLPTAGGRVSLQIWIPCLCFVHYHLCFSCLKMSSCRGSCGRGSGCKCGIDYGEWGFSSSLCLSSWGAIFPRKLSSWVGQIFLISTLLFLFLHV